MTLRLGPQISAYELEMFIRMFADHTFRVKGFIQTRDQGTVLADCVGNVVCVTPADVNVSPEKLGVLTILSGGRMPLRSAVQTACRWYESYVIPGAAHQRKLREAIQKTMCLSALLSYIVLYLLYERLPLRGAVSEAD